MTKDTLTQAPLETLVIAHLNAIREHEMSLHAKFTVGQNPQGVAAELFHLQLRADRLNRMIDAMNTISPDWQNLSASFSAA